MSTSRDHDRARSRVEAVCASTLTERDLRAAILAALRPAIGFDSYVWLLTDPSTTVGYAPLADVPCLPELPTLIRLKYLTAVNRWTSLRRESCPVGLLRHSTGGDLRRSQQWRDLLCGFAVTDIASVVFDDKHGCWGFLDLWRQSGSPFDDAAATLLADIAPGVCKVLRRRQADAFSVSRTDSNPADGPAVLTLTADLQIIGRTTAATGWLRSLLPTSLERDPVPAAAYNVAAQLLAAENGVDDHPASARAWVPGRTWVTLRASRLESTDLRPGVIAVSIEETAAGPRLELFARCFGLTAREQQLLSLLARGADTREIAAEMVISDYTVQDHLKSIFGKTALAGRSALITTAVGPRDSP